MSSNTYQIIFIDFLTYDLLSSLFSILLKLRLNKL